MDFGHEYEYMCVCVFGLHVFIYFVHVSIVCIVIPKAYLFRSSFGLVKKKRILRHALAIETTTTIKDKQRQCSFQSIFRAFFSQGQIDPRLVEKK